MAEMTFLRSCAEHPVAADFTEVNTFFQMFTRLFLFLFFWCWRQISQAL